MVRERTVFVLVTLPALGPIRAPFRMHTLQEHYISIFLLNLPTI
jgi:hypothetical protein